MKRTLDLPEPINEGWGITKDIQVDSKGNLKQWFYVSNGSSKIFIVDPETLAIKESVEVIFLSITSKFHKDKKFCWISSEEFK